MDVGRWSSNQMERNQRLKNLILKFVAPDPPVVNVIILGDEQLQNLYAE